MRIRRPRRFRARFEISAIELAVDALAAYRLTRLATVDTLPVAVAARDRVSRWSRDAGHPAVDELLHCPWCIGFWIAAAVVGARAAGQAGWDPIARTLAISTVTGVIAHYLSDEVVRVKPAEPDEDAGEVGPAPGPR